MTPRLIRLTLAGNGFSVDEPAAGVGLLLQWPGEALTVPTWKRQPVRCRAGKGPGDTEARGDARRYHALLVSVADPSLPSSPL